jgi:mannose-6-phosphate isomerase-like protein (cupin superfamily)
MTEEAQFEYVRQADLARIAALGPDERLSLKLLDRTTGAERVGLNLIRTPPGGGSPEGLHTHEFEQVFYVLEGRMAVEIAGETFEVGPGAVVVFPEGVPHRNWTARDEPTLHLAINVPAPELGRRLAHPVH